MNASDQELIKLVLSNEAPSIEKGWRYVYSTYYPMVRDMVRKHGGSEEDAVDIFQDGILIFDRNLRHGTFRGESSIKTYIFGICKNLWRREFYKRNKKSIAETELMNESGDDVEPLINVEVVSLLMNELQEECQRILIEFYFNNRSMAELKDMFNVNSVQAAKNKKWRCLGYLVKLFKEKGIPI